MKSFKNRTDLGGAAGLPGMLRKDKPVMAANNISHSVANEKRSLVSKVLDALDSGSMWVGMAALTIIVLQMGIEVVLRYVFNIAIHYLEMSSLYFLFYIALIPAGAILRHREHLAVSLLPDYLKSHHKTKGLRVLNTIILLVSLSFFVTTFYFAVVQTKYHIIMKTTYFEELWAHAGRVPIIVTFIAFPIGFLLLIIFTLEALALIKRQEGTSE